MSSGAGQRARDPGQDKSGGQRDWTQLAALGLLGVGVSLAGYVFYKWSTRPDRCDDDADSGGSDVVETNPGTTKRAARATKKSEQQPQQQGRDLAQRLTPAQTKAAEDKLITAFIQLSKHMQQLAASGGNADAQTTAPLEQMQRQRHQIVAALSHLRGRDSVARLEEALATLQPAPPPPEPEAMHRQVIAHRIMVDPNFQVGESKQSALQTEVMKTMRAAYWDSVRWKIESSGDPAPVLHIVKDLCHSIINIMGESPKFQAKMETELTKRLDLTQLQMLAEEKALGLADLAGVVRALAGVIALCQSPARDEANAAWLRETLQRLEGDGASSQLTQLVELVEPVFDGLFRMVDEVKRDCLKSQVEMLRNELQHNGKGVEYQREAFAERLRSGEITLARSRQWLTASLDKVLVGRKRSGTDAVTSYRQLLVEGNHNACSELLAFSILATIYDAAASGTRSADANMLPETLTVETHELSELFALAVDSIQSLTMVVMGSTFAQTQLGIPALSEAEKGTAYDFFFEASSAPVAESATEIEVPRNGSETGESGGGETKRVTLIAQQDPHKQKGRRARLESAAIFLADLVRKRGEDIAAQVTTEKVSKLQVMMMQLADDPSEQQVYKVAVTLMRKHVTAGLAAVFRATGKESLDIMVERIFKRSPLRPPNACRDHSAKLIGRILTITRRNMTVYQDYYRGLMKEAATSP